MRNRTLLATATAFVILAYPAPRLDAQTTFGFRGGVSVASASADIGETFDKSNRTGFAGGVFLDMGGSGILGFQVGAQYTQKGVELDVGEAVREPSLDYLEIPAVVKVGLPLEVLKPSVFVGAGLGFNTSCDDGGADCGDDVTSTEWSGIIGADVVLYTGAVSLWADGRFNVGLSDIADSESYQELKNRAWTLQAGLGFPAG